MFGRSPLIDEDTEDSRLYYTVPQIFHAVFDPPCSNVLSCMKAAPIDKRLEDRPVERHSPTPGMAS